MSLVVTVVLGATVGLFVVLLGAVALASYLFHRGRRRWGIAVLAVFVVATAVLTFLGFWFAQGSG